ncbi:MAG: hypothetical protein EOP88_01995 [Verrucomicrobiaceae bacterium]|nr:MAG: hypothetical protein EOP88_01995 [Verrucomicrobiaceae bacterium]
MNFRLLASSLLVAAISASLSSCFSSSKVNTKNDASVGQQLIELERARQQGIVSEKEYAKLKKRIIKDND